MSFWTSIGFKTTQANNELPDIFPLGLKETDFVRIDVQNIFTRILTDVLERTQGLGEKYVPLLWDNCVASESADGLVTMVAKAMAEKHDLFLVYDPATDVIRKATPTEETTIRNDYKREGESSVGTFVSFKNYTRSDMVRLYSALEYCSVAGLHKSMKLSTAVQLKLTDMRASVGLSDKDDAVRQAVAIAEGLKAGRDIMMDAKDLVETATPNLDATKASMEFIAQKRSFYLGLPASYITGVASKGLGDTGNGDARAIERGLKNYFFAVVKPILDTMFDSNVTFESEDFEQLTGALEALKTFDVTSDDHLSQENKTVIINKLFGLPEDTEGDEPKPEVAPVAPVVPPVVPEGNA